MNVENYVMSLHIPSDSPSLNGVYLEGIIPGFRTSWVEGRYNVAMNVEDGPKNDYSSRFKKRKLSSKDFIVHFNITCNNPENLNKSIQLLNKTLFSFGSEKLKVIFKDRPDIYYTGVVSDISTQRLVDHMNASGSYTLHLADSKGYSVEEFEATPTENNGKIEFTIDYNGSIGAFPVLEATANSEVGYLDFTVNNDASIKVGNPNSKKAQDAALNSTFSSATLPAGWTDGSYTPTKDMYSPEDETFTVGGAYSYDKKIHAGLYITDDGTRKTANNHIGRAMVRSLSSNFEDFIATFTYILNLSQQSLTGKAGGIEFDILGHEKDSIETVEIARIRVNKPTKESSKGFINLSVRNLDGTYTGQQLEIDFSDWTGNTYTGKGISVTNPTT